MLEKEIVNKVKLYALAKGWLFYKWTSPSRIGVPDNILISPVGKVVFMEFKQLGKKPTVMQEREHLKLRNNCATVYVVDSVELGRGIIDALS
jgi:hypothetical protein